MNMDWLKNRLSTDKGRREYCNSVGVNSAIRGLRQNLSQATLTTAQTQELLRRLSFCHAVRKEIMAGFEVANPTITFRERYELDLGDIHLRLTYWGDGICHSSIFVHIVEDNMLVGMGMGGGWLPSFYGKTSLEGIRNAISLYKQLGDENFRIDLMIGIHNPELITSRRHFQHHYEYLKALLDDLTKAKQEGLSLQQAKDRLSIDKRYPYVRRDFTMPQNLIEGHQKNIDTIWELLQEKS